MATLLVTFTASRRQDSWENFVTGISSRRELAYARPTLDGPEGLFPDYPSRLFSQGKFARLPFIAGKNLDEGTLFVRSTINLSEDQEKAYIAANFSPPGLPDEVVDKLFELYPDDPALGSPYNTGNETFGLSKTFKRMAALSGDISFQSQRRLWSQTAAAGGVKTYGYHFEQHLLSVEPYLGVSHASEVPFVYGLVPVMNETASSVALSRVMMDYWIAFAASLDPNDGLGVSRPLWPQYTPDNQVLMQLNGENLTTIPDDYHKEQIDFINDNAVLFHH
ncbi:Alpha/Beta hydrolase protein [Mucidula mucida]|nr:Alpha/Beta hydrolase protein [Mucidula mucida]